MPLHITVASADVVSRHADVIEVAKRRPTPYAK
jgi:hypothetical protein